MNNTGTLTEFDVFWKNKVQYPTTQTEFLKSKLEDLKESISNLKEYKNDDYIDLSDPSPANIKLQVMIHLEISMKIRKLFLNFMILILGNFPKFYSKTHRHIFEYEKYIASMPSQSRPFYKAFTQTQIFNSFLKQSRANDNYKISEFKNYMKLIYKNDSALLSDESSSATKDQ